MNDTQRHLYRLLHKTCKFIDKNPSLKNVLLSSPTHLYSLKAKTVEHVAEESDTTDLDPIHRIIHTMNGGGQYFNPISNNSLTSSLHSEWTTNQNIDLQMGFNALRVLNDAQG
eukprot:104855_1